MVHSAWTPRTVATVCVALFVAGGLLGLGLRAPAPTDWLRGVEAAALVCTGVIVFWYTVETARLREVGEAQLAQAAEQSRASVRPVLRLDAEGGLLRLTNIGLGPALEVTLQAPALTGAMVQLQPGMWECHFTRLPVIAAKEECTPRWYVTQEGPGAQSREGVSPSFLHVVKQLPPGHALPIEVVYLDLHLHRIRARFEFRRGEPIAFPVATETLGPNTDPEPTVSRLVSPARDFPEITP